MNADEVAAAFGLGRALRLEGPVARGRMGEVWRLQTERGHYAVKRSDEPPDPDEVERDTALQETFARGGVPLPRPVRTPDGEALGQVGGEPLRVHEWVDMAGPDRRLDPAAVGRLVAALHRVEIATTEPFDGWYADPVGADGWAALVEGLRAAGAPYAERLAALVPEVLEAERGYRRPDRLQVCHRDLWADNVRATATGGLVVFDWEAAGPAGVDQELALVLLEHGDGDPDRWRAIHAAYRESDGPGRVTDRGDFTMALAQTAHITGEGCRRWLADPDPQARADNAGWVAEFLDDPFHRHVDDVLAALRTPRRP